MFHYGQGHPMKPHRVRMAHNLIVNYGLYKDMDVFRPQLVDAGELTRFHSDDYINFLRAVTPDNMHEHLRQLQRFNVGEDCAWAARVWPRCLKRQAHLVQPSHRRPLHPSVQAPSLTGSLNSARSLRRAR